jgi:hypothetical protein
LREAWFGPMSAPAIAEVHGVSKNTVRRFWKEERIAGRLPAEPTPRPHFVERSKPKPSVVEPVDGDAIDDLGPPIGDPNPRYDAQCDALLAALREHHADIDNAEAHTAPASWLVWDRTRPARAPSHAALMLMCREYDARVRA